MIQMESQLFQKCSSVQFPDGESIWNYIHGPLITYLPPTEKESDDHLDRIKKMSWQDLPSNKQDRNMHLHFGSFVQGHNPELHPSFNVSIAELTKIFVNGSHPKVKADLIGIKNSAAEQIRLGLQFPALIAAHEPGAGNAHPQAGTLDISKLIIYADDKFKTKLDANEFNLKGNPQIMSVSEDTQDNLTPNDIVQGKYVYIAWEDMDNSNSKELAAFTHQPNLHDLAQIMFSRDSGKLRTCKNCGGVGHMAWNSEKGDICPTLKSSVPEALLRKIRYPIDVNPWRFGSGKGSGKGKGKGKPSKGKYVFVNCEDSKDVQTSDASSSAQTSDGSSNNDAESSKEASYNVSYITYDDHDGFNE